MAFRILEDETVDEGVKRIAREQIDKALNEIEDDDIDSHETVHQVRKRCKKIRGLIRIVRPTVGEGVYQRENTWYRDAARRLSDIRDAEGVIECVDDLTDHYDKQVDKRAINKVRRELVRRRDEMVERDVELDGCIEAFAQSMREGRDRVSDWPIDETGFDALADGLGKTYKRGRKAMALAYDEPTTEHFHNWRKRVKYHWYHARILREMWKPVMKGWRKQAHELSDLLGDEHDLAVLRQTVLDEPDAFGKPRDTQALLGLIDRRRAELRARAHTLGMRLYAEPRDRMLDRVGAWFNAWRHACTLDPKVIEQQMLATV